MATTYHSHPWATHLVDAFLNTPEVPRNVRDDLEDADGVVVVCECEGCGDYTDDSYSRDGHTLCADCCDAWDAAEDAGTDPANATVYRLLFEDGGMETAR